MISDRVEAVKTLIKGYLPGFPNPWHFPRFDEKPEFGDYAEGIARLGR
jgi:hypothetical protein